MPGTNNDVTRFIQILIFFPGQSRITIMRTQVPIGVKYRILLHYKQARLPPMERVKSFRLPLRQLFDMAQFYPTGRSKGQMTFFL